ncbi:hypothetical protein [Jeotgalibacillus sp. R-1-5s-1]|uniref:hypothetical protein n=1 Tax=Jeotgalibacillus sp. R-1-5s-1 TaxID=2555897 RepID=UPI0010690DF4|nr:hypothetical protein [Jeotgalibacillus sp. R-1-5s-1]TFD97059.1 hypothetical protein E2491_10225 [Jeotgalibacillus sp. R-1-5s-1]
MVVKNPGIAVLLSFFLTGLGQIYNGHILKGVLMIVLQIVNAFLVILFIGMITYPLVWVWGLYDAYKSADRINQEKTRLQSTVFL